VPSPPGADAAHEAPSTPARRDLPRVIIATGRDQARRLVAALPASLQAQLVLVLPAPIGDADEAGAAGVFAGRIVEAEPVPPPKPRPRGRSPLARLRRAVFRPAPTADELLARAVDAAARTTGSARGPLDIVAIDAPAVAFVARLGDRRARLAPGSLRWLADRWDAEAHLPTT
jgi:hypothetical protein